MMIKAKLANLCSPVTGVLQKLLSVMLN